MIKDYFGLSETPFTRYVPPANLYRGQAWQELAARLDHAVRNRALGVITGEVGAGKSTAVRALASRLDPVRYPFIYIAASCLEPRVFYREVLSQFGVTPAYHQRDARRQFDRLLLDAYENQGKQPVLVIDEAHLLSASMLAEVRFLTNFQFDSLSPFALILVGQPELRAVLADQFERGLEVVLIEPGHVVDPAQDSELIFRLKAAVAGKPPHHCPILLLYVAVVVLLAGPRDLVKVT